MTDPASKGWPQSGIDRWWSVEAPVGSHSLLREPLDSRIFCFSGGGEQCSLRCGRCPPVGPGLLLARKNRSLASRTSGGPIWRHTENHAFRTERNARLPSQKKNGLVGKKDGVRPVEHLGPKKCLHLQPTVFLRNYTERVDPPLPFVLETFLKVSSPRAPRRRQRNQPACCGGAAFLFHNKTWTIIPTLGSLRVYVHPWSGTVSFRFLPCSRYPNSRKSTPSCISIQDPSRRVEVLRGSTRNAMLTHKTTPPPESFAGTTLRRRTTARRGFTAQGPCRGKALSQRIEDAQLRTT
ncbi:hypothetical protein V6N12_076088 [Hibiscus sabdariffa]|uniref:Uncharacterized protein n=1 Tax=Hibiscus sabdariffa TaxID=183260 RepID=A0ABR2AY82_9ROSI